MGSSLRVWKLRNHLKVIHGISHKSAQIRVRVGFLAIGIARRKWGPRCDPMTRPNAESNHPAEQIGRRDRDLDEGLGVDAEKQDAAHGREQDQSHRK